MATGGETQKEMRAHEGTYSLFVGLMKWGAILSVVTGLIVIFIIAN
jgi:Bacterial aa3 type cytochrome c oxidase subunit IV